MKLIFYSFEVLMSTIEPPNMKVIRSLANKNLNFMFLAVHLRAHVDANRGVGMDMLFKAKLIIRREAATFLTDMFSI